MKNKNIPLSSHTDRPPRGFGSMHQLPILILTCIFMIAACYIVVYIDTFFLHGCFPEQASPITSQEDRAAVRVVIHGGFLLPAFLPCIILIPFSPIPISLFIMAIVAHRHCHTWGWFNFLPYTSKLPGKLKRWACSDILIIS